jgi:hypothetical protein
VKEGTEIVMTHYNAKDKVQSTDHQKILTKAVEGGKITITTEVESFDDKDKSVFKRNLTYICDNGIFFFDMQSFMNPEALAGFKDMKMSVSATNLEFPNSPSAGQTLADGNVSISISNEGVQLMNMTVKVFNRKIEAVENITTPAGTFSCYKVTYDVESKVMFKVSSKGIDWIAKEVGVVRTESYDSKGKLVGYSVLTSLK